MQNKRKVYLYYTLEFILIAVFLLYCFGSFSFIYGGDGYNQLYPAMVYCGKYIRSVLINILHGNFVIPQFDFSIGLGEGIIPALNYYGFGDPFMLLSAVFPASYSTYAYTLIILLKIYASGLSFLFYCRRRNCDDKYILAGVPVYIVSSYVLYFGLQLPSYLNTMIAIPLLCAGIDGIMVQAEKEKKLKFSVCFVLATAFLAVSGFYFLYMSLLFAAVYGLVCIICRKRVMGWVLKNIGSLLCQVFLGLGLGAVILLPSVCGYFSSSRGNGMEFPGWKELLGVGADGYWSVFSQVIVPTKYSAMGLLLPAVAIFAIVMAVKKKEQSKDIKILAVILLIGYLNTHMTSWIAGGFSNAVYNNRWLCCFIFILAYLVCEGCSGLEKENKKKWLIFLGVCAAYMVVLAVVDMVYWDTGKRVPIYAVYMVFTAVTVILALVIKRERGRYYVILGSVAVGTLLNVYTTFSSEPEQYTYGKKWFFKPYSSVRNEILASDAQLYSVQNPLGRVDIAGNILNESLYTGSYSTTEYLSILNSNLYDFYENYGIVSEMKGARHYITGLEYRNGLEDLLSVEWYDDEQKGEVIQNENAIPFGFTFDSYISQNNAENTAVIEKNAAILDTLIVDGNVEEISESEELLQNENLLSEEAFQIEYVNIEKTDDLMKVTEDSRIYITVDSSKAGECYLQADKFLLKKGKADWYWVHVNIGNMDCEFVSDKNPYSNGIESGLYNLGMIPEGKSVFEIAFTEEAEFLLDDIHIYRIDTDEMERLNEERRKETLQNVDHNGNTIQGSIKTDGKKLLFLSVPYSLGWKAYINGEEAEILKADYGFMALELDEGESEICLKYVTPGLVPGAVCTIVSLGIFVVVWCRKRKE